MSTVVQFNEVGKATHVRDIVDVCDVIETFVPLAKRFGWLTRRVTGLFSSTIGSLALAMIPGPIITVAEPVKLGLGIKADTGRKAHAVNVGPPSVPPPRSAGPGVDDDSSNNTLGLEGVAGQDT